jgi:hypothetical protein
LKYCCWISIIKIKQANLRLEDASCQEHPHEWNSEKICVTFLKSREKMFNS